MGRFAGKVLFATGGASGIGAATARRFAAEGGRVAVADLDRDRAAEVASALAGSLAIACDVADERAVAAAVRVAREQLGRIDGVLNSAGFVKFTPLEELSLEEWNRLLAVHLTGTFLVCRAALPVLRESGGGSIVNVASVAGLLARPHLAAADDVRVNVLAPGSVTTPLLAGVYGEDEVPHSIQGRFGEPEEIAAAACFLLSDEAGFFTAAMLVADGGATAL